MEEITEKIRENALDGMGTSPELRGQNCRPLCAEGNRFLSRQKKGWVVRTKNELGTKRLTLKTASTERSGERKPNKRALHHCGKVARKNKKNYYLIKIFP